MRKKSLLFGMLIVFIIGISTSLPMQGLLGQPLEDNWYKSPCRETSVYGLATDLVGKKNKPGGNIPAGFDQSGFIQYLFKTSTAKINLPHNVAEQYKLGDSVPLTKVCVGDLLFFGVDGKIQEVGISLIDCPFWPDLPIDFAIVTKKGVSLESLGSPYWKKHFLEAKRILQPSTQAQQFYMRAYALAKQGKLFGCPFVLGTPKSEIYEKWGKPKLESSSWEYYEKKTGREVQFDFNTSGTVNYIRILFRKDHDIGLTEIQKILGSPKDYMAGKYGAFLTYAVNKNTKFIIGIADQHNENNLVPMISISRYGQ